MKTLYSEDVTQNYTIELCKTRSGKFAVIRNGLVTEEPTGRLDIAKLRLKQALAEWK